MRRARFEPRTLGTGAERATNCATTQVVAINKDVFMCILRFHARAGYLQHYETMLKELNTHPGTDPVPPDQYEVERAALSDRNLNVPCESGICYPSFMVMLNRRHTQSKIFGNVMSCSCT